MATSPAPLDPDRLGSLPPEIFAEILAYVLTPERHDVGGNDRADKETCDTIRTRCGIDTSILRVNKSFYRVALKYLHETLPWIRLDVFNMPLRFQTQLGSTRTFPISAPVMRRTTGSQNHAIPEGGWSIRIQFPHSPTPSQEWTLDQPSRSLATSCTMLVLANEFDSYVTMLRMNDLTHCLRIMPNERTIRPRRSGKHGLSMHIEFKSPRNTNLDTKILDSLSRLCGPFHQFDFSGSTNFEHMDSLQDTMELWRKEGNLRHELMTHKTHTFFEAMGLVLRLKHLGDEALLRSSLDGLSEACTLYQDAITFAELWVTRDVDVQYEHRQFRSSYSLLHQIQSAACLCNMAIAYFTGGLDRSSANVPFELGDILSQTHTMRLPTIFRLSNRSNNPRRHLELAYIASLVRLVDLRDVILDEWGYDCTYLKEQCCSVLLSMQHHWSNCYQDGGTEGDRSTILGKMYAMVNSLLANTVLASVDANHPAAAYATGLKVDKFTDAVESMCNLLRGVSIAPVKWCISADILDIRLVEEITKFTCARKEDLRGMKRSTATTGGVYDEGDGPILLMFSRRDPLTEEELEAGETNMRFML